MGKSSGTQQSTDDRLVLLVEQQKLTKEGSSAWYTYQQQINQLIAERYLQMLNT